MSPKATMPPTTCAAMNDGAEDGAIPANVLENMRPTVMAGLAKLVELVKKYAAPMYAPTAAGADLDRPERARAKITSSRPSVAMTSDRKWAADARCLVESSNAALENIRLASTAPLTQPAVCAGRYAAASLHERPPKPASTKDTTGLKCPPETGPNIKMMA